MGVFLRRKEDLLYAGNASSLLLDANAMPTDMKISNREIITVYQHCPAACGYQDVDDRDATRRWDRQSGNHTIKQSDEHVTKQSPAGRSLKQTDSQTIKQTSSQRSRQSDEHVTKQTQNSQPASQTNRQSDVHITKRSQDRQMCSQAQADCWTSAQVSRVGTASQTNRPDLTT